MPRQQSHNGKRQLHSSSSSTKRDQSNNHSSYLSANDKGITNLNSSMLSEGGNAEFGSVNVNSSGNGGNLSRTPSMMRRVREAATRGGLLAQQKQTAAQSAIADAKKQQTQILLPPKVVEKLKETFHEHHDRIDDFWGVHAILTEHCNLQVSPVLLSRIIHEQGLSRPQQQQKERQRKLQQLQQVQQAQLQQFLQRTNYQGNKGGGGGGSTATPPTVTNLNLHRASVANIGNNSSHKPLGIAGPVIDATANASSPLSALPPIQAVASRSNSIALTENGPLGKSLLLQGSQQSSPSNQRISVVNEYSGTVKHTADEPAVQLDEDSFVLLAQTIAFDERYDEEFRSDDRSLVNIAVSESVPEIAKQHHLAQQALQPMVGGGASPNSGNTSSPLATATNRGGGALPPIMGGAGASKEDPNSLSSLSSTRARGNTGNSPFVMTDARHISAMALDHFLSSFDLQYAIDDLAPKDYLNSKREAANVKAAIVASTHNLGNNNNMNNGMLTSTSSAGGAANNAASTSSATGPLSLALHSFTSRITVNTTVPLVVDQAIDLDQLYKKLNVKEVDKIEAGNGNNIPGSMNPGVAGKSSLNTNSKTSAVARKGTIIPNNAAAVAAVRNPLVKFGALPSAGNNNKANVVFGNAGGDGGTSVLFNTAASGGTTTNRFRAPVDDATIARMDNAQLELWLAYGVGDNEDSTGISTANNNNSYSAIGSGNSVSNKHNSSVISAGGNDPLDIDGGATDSLGHTSTFQRASEVLGGLPTYPSLEVNNNSAGGNGNGGLNSQQSIAFGKRSQSFRGKPSGGGGGATSNTQAPTDSVSLLLENARKTLASTNSKLTADDGSSESSQTPASFRSPSTQALQTPSKKPGNGDDEIPLKKMNLDDGAEEKDPLASTSQQASADPTLGEEGKDLLSNNQSSPNKKKAQEKDAGKIGSTRRTRKHEDERPWRTNSKVKGASGSGKEGDPADEHSPYHHKKRPLVEASKPSGGWRSHLHGKNANDGQAGGHHHIHNPAHEDPFYDYSTSDLQELRPFVSATVQRQIDEVLHARQEEALRDLLAADTDGADKGRGCVFTEETALKKAKVIAVPYQKKVTSKINGGASPSTPTNMPPKEVTSKQLQASVIALNKSELESERAATANEASSTNNSPAKTFNASSTFNDTTTVEEHAIDPQMLRWVSSSKKPVAVNSRR